jgi:hypothetical protein
LGENEKILDDLQPALDSQSRTRTLEQRSRLSRAPVNA